MTEIYTCCQLSVPLKDMRKREMLAKRRETWITMEGIADIEGGIKCPRCYRKTSEGHYNHDGLCNRSCEYMVKHYPDDERTIGINAAYKAQRERTPSEWRAINHKIDPISWP